jgi:excisionase family DNA binding protein
LNNNGNFRQQFPVKVYNKFIFLTENPMENRLPEIMTIEEVAEYLRVPVSSLYKLAQQGKIPASKVGRHWRFRREFIDRWINDQARGIKPDRVSKKGSEGE